MTQDEIIEMARQVYGECVWHESALLRLEAFVKLVAAKEREACAQVLDEMAEQMVKDMEPSPAIAWVRNRAGFIRARGQQ